ncbi:MAG: wax ester/triacylglycerol synthase family O-acyltransferase [Nevskiales bacterium]|nr:wax ester/triacylglycerol synthase family O-acyltransferase [Nevskiales bacterium]
MTPVNPMDLGFLLLERRNQPMHVGGLILARPPADAGPDYAQTLLRDMLAYQQPEAPFNQRLHRRAGVWCWTRDEEFDLDSHVYHLSLPEPGRIRELLALVSKLHSALLDRSKPLWEAYVIEGVQDGRIALYIKVHHALVDGVAAMKLMQRVTSTDPAATVVAPWAVPPRIRDAATPERSTTALTALADAASQFRRHAGSAKTVATEVLRSIRARKTDPDYVSVFQAPRSLFNQRISGSRRFAAQSYAMARIRNAADRHQATINDIVLAMCGSALRRYLLDLGELPDKPLVAMVPVSMRRDDSEGGNQVAMILANLATHLDDPLERLDTTVRSVNQSKQRFSRLSQGEILAYMTTVMAAHGANMALGINPGWQAFNVIISNVPGPREPLYWNGAAVEGVYPVSIPIDGAALNITLNSYADSLEFGLIGCRRTLPHMQRLLGYLDDGLSTLGA